jgi:hypothetical protein
MVLHYESVQGYLCIIIIILLWFYLQPNPCTFSVHSWISFFTEGWDYPGVPRFWFKPRSGLHSVLSWSLNRQFPRIILEFRCVMLCEISQSPIILQYIFCPATDICSPGLDYPEILICIPSLSWNPYLSIKLRLTWNPFISSMSLNPYMLCMQ